MVWNLVTCNALQLDLVIGLAFLKVLHFYGSSNDAVRLVNFFFKWVPKIQLLYDLKVGIP